MLIPNLPAFLKFATIHLTFDAKKLSSVMISITTLKLRLCYFLLVPAMIFIHKIPEPCESKNYFNNRIGEERFIKLNGIEQWVTIKGDSTKPVILFLHGGPGSPISPFSDSIYGEWEKDFVIVQWDQRGTGKTYGRNAPEELTPEYLKLNPLTTEQMTTDGIDLSEYLVKYLGKKKIFLFGSSWGSILGARMALKRPELFYAYVGHSQVVTPSDNLVYDYQEVYQRAQKADDKQSLQILDSIGKPPYDIAKNSGKLFRIIKKYERENSVPAPTSWSHLSPGYNNEKDSQHRDDGDDYSFVNYVGDKRIGIKPMMLGINFLKDGLDFKIPVYLIQGEEDILTPKEITEAYFNKIKAPSKKFIVLPNTAHGFNLLVVETHYNIMKGFKANR